MKCRWTQVAYRIVCGILMIVILMNVLSEGRAAAQDIRVYAADREYRKHGTGHEAWGSDLCEGNRFCENG